MHLDAKMAERVGHHAQNGRIIIHDQNMGGLFLHRL
jgi:hypothetical protein